VRAPCQIIAILSCFLPPPETSEISNGGDWRRGVGPFQSITLRLEWGEIRLAFLTGGL
jgi:hypothetical protein